MMPTNSIRFSGTAMFAVAALAMLSSGCATPALWKHTAALEWSPKFPPGQFLLTTTAGREDVLVVFEQYAWSGTNARHRLVAWNASKPPDQLVVGRRALQRLTNACDRVALMPVFDHEPAAGEGAPAPAAYAVGQEWPRFTIHLEGVSSETLELPGSHQGARVWPRVVVTPLAVAADAALALGAAIAFGLAELTVLP